MLPSIVNQLGPEGFASLRKMAMEKVDEEKAAAPVAESKDDDVPELEGDFEQASKQEEEESKAVWQLILYTFLLIFILGCRIKSGMCDSRS